MKITMLGTGAVGYPLAFCNCDNCKIARIKKGKSIRKRASILINDDLIIDLGPDVQYSMSMYDKDMGKVKYLLQTHMHTDHFDDEMIYSRRPYTNDKRYELLNIYAHSMCIDVMNEKIKGHIDAEITTQEGMDLLKIKINRLKPNDTFKAGNYEIKAIECMHDLKKGSLTYLINENNKRLFYAVDTNELTENALKQLENIHLDIIIMDHTFGDTDYSHAHLNEKLFIEQIEKLKNINCIDKNTIIYASHISHDGLQYHEKIEEKAIKNGYHIAYDGLEIEI